MTFVFTNVDEALPVLAKNVLRYGATVPARGGTTTREQTMQSITLLRPEQREITLGSRGASLPAQIAETMWVLGGRDDIEWLGHYLPRAADFSDDGETWHGAYGRRLRNWYGVDQLEHVVRMLKEDPGTRRAAMVIYDPTRDTDYDGKDVPCNNWLHFLARDGRLDLHVAVRSNDLMWGWSGINAFEWSSLLEVVAGLTGLAIGRLHFSVSSLHLYDRHFAKAERIAKDHSVAELKLSPRLKLGVPHQSLLGFDDLVERWFQIEEWIRDGDAAKHGVTRQFIQTFPEPMLCSWLAVIAWWWSGDGSYLAPYDGTRLAVAAQLSPGRPHTLSDPVNRPFTAEKKPEPTSFIDYVVQLHTEKDAAYGDSWKRRGEMLGIMANIARKIDRLGVAGAGDTAADTAVDLFVYLAKYWLWLWEQSAFDQKIVMHDQAKVVGEELKRWYSTRGAEPPDDEVLIIELKTMFDDLEKLVVDGPSLGKIEKQDLVGAMARKACQLAESLWTQEQ